MRICVYGASSDYIDRLHLEAGEKLGELIAKGGHTLVFGGGAQGMMGAAARGTSRQKGKILGISPSFFNVDGILYQHCTEFIYTDTMRERKQLLEEKSDAFIMTAGGIGTFEEFFEILTLKQLATHNKPIVVLNTGHYYDDMLKMLRTAVDGKFMQEATLGLFTVTSTPEEALEACLMAQEQKDIHELKHI